MLAYWLAYVTEPVPPRFVRDRALVEFCSDALGAKVSRDRASKAWAAADSAGLLAEVGERNGKPTFELKEREQPNY